MKQTVFLRMNSTGLQAKLLVVNWKIVCFAWMTFCLGCALNGCSSLPQIERHGTYVIPDTSHTGLAKAIAPILRTHPGMSGIYPLEEGGDAIGARIGLARAAQRSLDIQYYIFKSDNAGLAMLGELLSAADRGVHVRLLLDDLHTAGQDRMFAAVAAHPNIQVRLFNPFANRAARWIDFVTDFGRVNRRMHNKSMTADRFATIVGGRNIGNEYFGAKSDVDFNDLDTIAVGPVVADVSTQFDQYWNSQLAYPITSLLHSSLPGEQNLRELRAMISEQTQSQQDASELAQNEMAKTIAHEQLPSFFWGKATVIADPPIKIMLPPQDSAEHAATKLLGMLGQAEKELLLVSPYFVPGKQGIQWLEGILNRGRQVQIITNSYAATDVRIVHAGYARYRGPLLRIGAKLYEMKPYAVETLVHERNKQTLTGSSRSSLHAKTYMTDERVVYIGSFNLDQRSARLNTELGVVVESEALCTKLRDHFVLQILNVAYRVVLGNDPQSGGQHLVWITRENGREVRYDSEPGIGPFRKLFLDLLRILPIEEQL